MEKEITMSEKNYYDELEKLLEKQDKEELISFIMEKVYQDAGYAQLVKIKYDKPEEISYLEEQWREIQQLYLQLSYEPYIDDQLEIDEVWEILEELVKYLNENDEEQALMKEIATLIEENDYYDEYGCNDPMEMLYNALKKKCNDIQK